MPVPYYGDFAEDDTVLIPFNTFDSNDPQASVTVTTLIASDIYVHKDGSTTDIVTDGATIAIDFDTVTGNHLITIDTSAHADYSTGSEYAVRIEGATVDAGNINAWVGSFSIERAGGALALIKAGNLSANVVQLGGVTQSATDLKDFADAGYDPATNKVQGVVLVDTTTTNTDMRGTDSAATASALATAQSDLDTITGADGATLASSQGNSLTFADITVSVAGAVDNITLAGSGTGDCLAFTRTGSGNLMDTAWAADLNAEANAACDTALTDYDAATGTELAAVDTKIDTIDTNVDAVLVDTGTTLPASIAALNDISVADILTTQMTESYAADGAAPTLTQALMLIQQTLGDFAISGTTLTVKKVDGSTTAATYTLDDGTNPTSITRAT